MSISDLNNDEYDKGWMDGADAFDTRAINAEERVKELEAALLPAREQLNAQREHIVELRAELERLEEIEKLATDFVESLVMKSYESGPYFFIGPRTDMRQMQKLASLLLEEKDE